MKAKFEIGTEIDFVSPGDLRSALSDTVNVWRERAQGVKWHEATQIFPTAPALPGSATVQGPAPGYAWKLRIVSSTLSATGTLAVYKGESANARAIAANNVTGVIQVVFFPDDIVIQSGQQLFVAVSTTMTNLYVGAVQVPAERLAEILG